MNLENVDFRTTGALSSFAGTTQFSISGATLPQPIQGIADFFPVSQTYLITGTSYAIVSADTLAAYKITGGTFLSIYTYAWPHVLGSYGSDFVRGDALYGTDGGYNFWRYPGFTTALEYSLPKPKSNPVKIFSGTGSGLTGYLTLYYAFLRYDGFVGPAKGYTFDVTTGPSTITTVTPSFPTGGLSGVSTGSFGISYLLVWYDLNGGLPQQYFSLAPLATTFFITPGGLTAHFGASAVSSAGFTAAADPDDYFGTFFYGFRSDCGSTTVLGSVAPVQPACIELCYNQLFSGGFANAPDDVWYSRIGELEKHDLEASFKVRANDGDIVSCLISYFTQLVIFKTNTTHVLSGVGDPDSFALSEVNSQYGCLSARGACVWRQQLWFLDKQGICQYDGANTQIVSNKMDDYFARMNISAARYQAIMRHVKDRNEVWCAIPIDGSTTNNIIIVYDYVADAWTTRIPPVEMTALDLISKDGQGLTQAVPYFGSYSGSIYQFGNSLLQDNGANFTSVIKTRFHSDLGHSVEKMWRRLYLDAVIPAGTTQNIQVNFYANQGTTAVYSTTMSMSQYQQRIDFGIPSKDLSVELIYNGGQFLQLNGYTLEYRFQRAT